MPTEYSLDLKRWCIILTIYTHLYYRFLLRYLKFTIGFQYRNHASLFSFLVEEFFVKTKNQKVRERTFFSTLHQKAPFLELQTSKMLKKGKRVQKENKKRKKLDCLFVWDPILYQPLQLQTISKSHMMTDEINDLNHMTPAELIRDFITVY